MAAQQSAREPLGLPSVSRRAGPPKLRVLLVSPLGRVVERMCPNGGQDKAPGKQLGFPRFPVGPGGTFYLGWLFYSSSSEPTALKVFFYVAVFTQIMGSEALSVAAFLLSTFVSVGHWRGT